MNRPLVQSPSVNAALSYPKKTGFDDASRPLRRKHETGARQSVMTVFLVIGCFLCFRSSGAERVPLLRVSQGQLPNDAAQDTPTGLIREGTRSPRIESDPARLARIRSSKMPAITKPVLFHTAEADPILAALEVFPPDNPFNQVIEDWPLHPNSAAIVASIGPDKPFRYTAETRCNREPADTRTPEQVFERHWAMTLLGTVLKRLRKQYDGDGKSNLFETLEPRLIGRRQ